MTDHRISIDIAVDARQGVAAVGQQSQALAALRQKADETQVSLKRLAVAVAAGGAALGALAGAARAVFVGLPRALLAGAAEAERLRNAFTVISGSAAAAAQEIVFLRSEAARLGLPLSEAGDAYLKLAAAARGTALEGEGARRVFSAVAGAAATLGLSGADAQGALLAISQMMSKGTVQAEELRGQLGERIPGAFQIAARAMGVSTAALSEMLDRGQILASDLLPRFAAQLAQEIPASANSTQAAITRLENALTQWRQGTGEALAVAIDGMLGLKRASLQIGQDGQIIEWSRKSAKAIAIVIDVVRELVLLVPNALKTVGGAIAGAARDIKLAVDIAGIALSQGIGEKGRAAMKQAIGERNAFIAQYMADMKERWFPKQLSHRIDEFFSTMRQGAQTGSQAVRTRDADLPARPRGSHGAIRPRDRAHGSGMAERLPELARSFDTEAALMQSALETQSAILESALAGQLIDIEAYWRARAAIQAQRLETERAKLQQELARQEAFIQRLEAVRPKDAVQREALADRLADARARAAELRADLAALDGKRISAEFDLKVRSDEARRQVREAVEAANAELARLTGAETPEQRRAAIAAGYRDMLAKIGEDAAARQTIERLIDVKAADANMQQLENRWRQTLEAMRLAEESANIQAQQGLITTAQAQERIAQAHRDAAAQMQALLPQLEQMAQTIGNPELANRIAAWRNELAQVKVVVDPVEQSITTAFKDAFSTLLTEFVSRTRSAKDAFLDFARAVISAINRIAAQKLAERLFGGGGGSGGLGGFIAGLIKAIGFAGGGYVTGPGTSTSDSIPARLSAGEYVVRADAVRRFGVAFFDAINGLRAPPVWDGRRLAFAAGGLAPAVQVQPVAPQVTQAVRIINAIDPGVTHDHLQTPAGERVIINIIGRNARAVRAALQG